jgi:hypothetical protein
MFTITALLVTAISAAVTFAPNLLNRVGPSQDSLRVLTVFTCCAVFYSLYARTFRISITIRQALFCFALTITPWYPLYVLIQANGGNLGVLWYLLQGYLALHVFVLVVRAVKIVSGAPYGQVVVSLMFAVLLASLPGVQSLWQTFMGGRR